MNHRVIFLEVSCYIHNRWAVEKNPESLFNCTGCPSVFLNSFFKIGVALLYLFPLTS